MIEEHMAERFRMAVATEPPLGFDPDEVVTEARRRQRRRRAVAASALATGGVVLAAVAVFAASTGAGQGQVATQPTSTEASAAPGPPDASGAPALPEAPPGPGPEDPIEENTEKSVDPPQPPPSFPGSEAAVARLRQDIPRILGERVSGLRFDVPDSGELMVTTDPRGIGGAYKAIGTKHRYVSVFVWHEKDTLDHDSGPDSAGDWGKVVSDKENADGSWTRVYGFDGQGQTRALTVFHFRTDGVVVEAGTTAKAEPGQEGLAVSEEVLTAIASDPRLRF